MSLRTYHDGIEPGYEPSVRLVEMIWESMDGVPKAKEERVVQRSEWIERSIDFTLYYGIHADTGGLGGCLTLTEWFDRKEADPKAEAMKFLLFDFVNAGFTIKDFMLVVWDVICKLQLNAAMAYCTD